MSLCSRWPLLGAVLLHRQVLSLKVDAEQSYGLSTEALMLAEMEMNFQTPKEGFYPLNYTLTEAPEISLYEKDLFANIGDSNMLMVQVLWQNQNNKSLGHDGEYPVWAVKAFQNTALISKKHGHTHMVRMGLTGKRSKHEIARCDRLKTPFACVQGYRNAATWEKFYMMLQYLESTKREFSHIIYMDIDASFPHEDRDVVRDLARRMDNHAKHGASLLVADMDWDPRWGGSGHANTGMLMAKNTPYAKRLLRALVTAHEDPEKSQWSCWMNEQICLQGFCRGSFPFEKYLPKTEEFSGSRDDNVLAVSGSRYGRNPDSPCQLNRDRSKNCTVDDVDIIHFMGRAKGYTVNSGLLPLGFAPGQQRRNRKKQ